ncbi:hypothetical protein DL766_000015 [Monosporascus sp. MC13-8B]|uniref:Zn(2)-C6 fungal-type domain-containing protein n=1 Tax=Monosporascus cannonballus TaxID=155416 RepID=A0ABY0HJ91_9PEZI|nr:hypothetical protein DL762_000384 [Monosporascus cannonballus]RYP01212.1 hypothetical protein DL763_000337 [Monosporascus cannonballus]RYP40214.1 hypothetical protein DL766_000015 [Monosporascus sp. MC13-8B]
MSAIPRNSALRNPDGSVMEQYIPRMPFYSPQATYDYFFGESAPAERRQVDLPAWIRDFWRDRAFANGWCENCLIAGTGCVFTLDNDQCDVCIEHGLRCKKAKGPREMRPQPEVPNQAPPAADEHGMLIDPALLAADARRFGDAASSAQAGPSSSAAAGPSTRNTFANQQQSQGGNTTLAYRDVAVADSCTYCRERGTQCITTPRSSNVCAMCLTFNVEGCNVRPPGPRCRNCRGDNGPCMPAAGAAGQCQRCVDNNWACSLGEPPEEGDDNEATLPGKGKGTATVAKKNRYRCNMCDERELDSCDADADRNRGCTNCRIHDQRCRWGQRYLANRPDGLLPPLCCDQCVNRELKNCSWRMAGNNYHSPCYQCQEENTMCTHNGVVPDQLARRGHTHLMTTQHLPQRRPLHMAERTAAPTLNWQGQQRGRSASPVDRDRNSRYRDRDDEPERGVNNNNAPPPVNNNLPPIDPNDFGPRPDPVTHIDPRRRYAVRGSLEPNHELQGFKRGTHCMLCCNRTGHKRPCDVNHGGEDREGAHGCTLCVRWGVVCSLKVGDDPNGIGHEPIPPHPNRTLVGAPIGTGCVPCTANRRRCDRKTPCDSCVQSGDRCTREKAHGGFRRGVSGDSLPTYYSSIEASYGQGRTLSQSIANQDPNRAALGVPYEQPPDLHLQYLQQVLRTRPEMLVDLGVWPEFRNPQPVLQLLNAPPPAQLQNVINNLGPPPPQQPEAPQHPSAPQAPGPAQNGNAEPAAPKQPLSSYQALVAQLTQAQEHAEFGDNYPARAKLAGYRAAMRLARDLSHVAQRFPHDDIYQQLRNDIARGVPAHQSTGVDVIRRFLAQGRANAENHPLNNLEHLAIRSPPHINHDALEVLNPGGRPIRLTAAFPPVSRPFSPGPMVPVFDFGNSMRIAENNVFDNSNVYPAGHPERIDMTRVRRLPQHPNPLPEPCLADIAFVRQGPLEELPGMNQGCDEWRDGAKCGRFTLERCASKWHNSAVPICDDCNNDSKDRLWNEWAIGGAIQSMRAYACYKCLLRAAQPQTYSRTGFRVWGLGPGAGGVDPTIRSRRGTDLNPFDNVNNGNIEGENVATVTLGGFCGPPLPITGCSCGKKLFGTRICTPHRTQHVIDMRAAADRIREYVKDFHGKMVCPFCRVNAGVDAYGFEGEEGGYGQRLAWACLACHGFVLAGQGENGPIDGAWQQFGVRAARPTTISIVTRSPPSRLMVRMSR